MAQLKFKAIRKHKILDKSEWEMFLRMAASDAKQEAFASRILIVPSRDNDFSDMTTEQVIDKLVDKCKKLIISNDNNFNGVIYIHTPDREEQAVITERKMFESIHISLYFHRTEDSEFFLSLLEPKVTDDPYNNRGLTIEA